MAADDDDRGTGPDPWDEIVADGLGDGAGEVSFRFEEASGDVPPFDAPAEPAAPGESAFAGDGDAPEAASPVEAAGEEIPQDWLSENDGATAAPPLAVYDPDDTAAGSSDIDIGTGGSGVALHGEAGQEEFGADAFAAAVAGDEEAAVGWPVAEGSPTGEVGGGEGDGDFLPAVAAGGAPASGGAPAKTVRRAPAKPARKSGGIGQMVGVVLGGLMAIPITLAILIYGLGKDPFGVTKKVPAEVAFLLPEKFRPGYKKPKPADTAVAGPSALDNLPTATEPVEPAEPADEPAPVEPPDVAAAVPDIPPVTDVAAVDAVDAVAAPGLDDLGAMPPEPAPPAEPPPLDTAALDAAVGDAAALGEALGAVDDRKNDAYTKLRTRWYKALARVAEELVAVENAAATTGRPLAAAPDTVDALHEGIGRREPLVTELAELGPWWLAYAKRGSDGIVVPVTFESARRVGPYWTAKVSLTDPDGHVRDLTVISRREPAAITGDRVVVTGVALDGAVIWAADVRGAAAGF